MTSRQENCAALWWKFLDFYVLTLTLLLNYTFWISFHSIITFTEPWNLYNVAKPRFQSEFTAPIRIASENRSVVDSKAYFVAFKILMPIVFQAECSVAFYFSFCVREGLTWSERNGKSDSKILKAGCADAILSYFVNG